MTGGRKLNQPGYFFEPTVFDGVTPEMNIAQEEVFGPVISVMTFSDDDEAIRMANNTDYGLVAGVFTKDLDRATAAAQRRAQLRARHPDAWQDAERPRWRRCSPKVSSRSRRGSRA